MKKAVITILGIQGGYINDSKHLATYIFEEQENNYFNTLPLLVEKYKDEYEIIPIYTKGAKTFNKKVMEELYSTLQVNYDEKYLIKDEKDFKDIFALYHRSLDKFDEVIIDVTHGFRHLPLLMVVELILYNFQDTTKIKKILFAKENKKHTLKEEGIYEIIDLKEYLELANISFVLTAFDKNYTVASHIESVKYQALLDALNNFSNDLMALNLNNLFKNSIGVLKKELDKIDEVSISTQANKLHKHIDETFKQYEKRYLTYYNLSRELFDKKYMLISLSLLNESLRLYIKTTIKKEHKEIVEKIEKFYDDDLYKIGDFFVKLNKSRYQKFQKKIENENKTVPIINDEFTKIKNSFPFKIKEKIKFENEVKEKTLIDHIGHKRNNLAHANSSTVSFDTIHKDIGDLIAEFEKRCIN